MGIFFITCYASAFAEYFQYALLYNELLKGTVKLLMNSGTMKNFDQELINIPSLARSHTVPSWNSAMALQVGPSETRSGVLFDLNQI